MRNVTQVLGNGRRLTRGFLKMLKLNPARKTPGLGVDPFFAALQRTATGKDDIGLAQQALLLLGNALVGVLKAAEVVHAIVNQATARNVADVVDLRRVIDPQQRIDKAKFLRLAQGRMRNHLQMHRTQSGKSPRERKEREGLR